MDYPTITSRNNELITEAVKLKQKKYRDERSSFFFEGKKLLSDACAADINVSSVFFTEENAGFVSSLPLKCDKYLVSGQVYDKLTDENSPSGIFCVALHLDIIQKMRTIYKDEEIFSPFAAVSVRDPGNLGTLIRTANAFGVGTLILSGDCADVYNPKTVRASMGALFRQRILIYEGDPVCLPAELAGRGFDVYAAELHKEARALSALDVSGRTCFCVGNEGHGLPEGFSDACAGSVFIPMCVGSESLNVSSAAAVLMWERFRRSL